MKTLCILLLIICSFSGIAQETNKHNATDAQQYYQDPEYAPMARLYQRYYDAYLYVLSPERRKDFLHWYNRGNKSAVDNREKYFQDVLRKSEQLTQAQRDSIMRIPTDETQKSMVEVKLTTFDEHVLGDSVPLGQYGKEALELFGGYPVYVVTRKEKGPSGELVWSSKRVYFSKTMNEVFSKAILRAQ